MKIIHTLFSIGLPRSGKSSYCNKIVENKPMTTIVCADDFRKALGSNYNPAVEQLVFAMVDISAKALLSRGFDIILDETHTTKDSLLRVFKIDINAEPVWIETSEEECIKRAILTGKDYLINPIKRISKQYNYLRDNYDKVVSEVKDYILSRKSQDVMV